MGKVNDPRPEGKAACIHCGMVHKIRIDKHELGQIMLPYAGGGNYGRCLKCKRGGLRVTDVPIEKAKTPVGWRKIPE